MLHSKDYIGLLLDNISTLGDLRDVLTKLTPDQLDFVCPKLVEWRERAIELQLEPAAMAAEQMRLWEKHEKLTEAGNNLRALLQAHTYDETAQSAFQAWDAAVGEKHG